MSVPATAKRNVYESMGGIGQFYINVAVREVALADEDGFVLETLLPENLNMRKPGFVLILST